MAYFVEESTSDVPILGEQHSGIPGYLLDKARDAKKGIFDTWTKPRNERLKIPVIPSGIGTDTFFEALDELRQDIGTDNVELTL
ncbi:hypothetical protein VMCG_08998 [Cytospora schulzeri]|uniref:Uncharacterized protein n=1 Tax=Cytospora schulzeri TaxID=448051 RepID=A0A423VPM1_9PEZI|nr:hypothetical protein VMCG_08998 [Valsa malicola]